MKKLSPAAQAVLDAINKELDEAPWDLTFIAGSAAAAALRAAANQVVPPAFEEEFNDRNQALPLKKMMEIRQKLNAIADELEAQ